MLSRSEHTSTHAHAHTQTCIMNKKDKAFISKPGTCASQILKTYPRRRGGGRAVVVCVTRRRLIIWKHQAFTRRRFRCSISFLLFPLCVQKYIRAPKYVYTRNPFARSRKYASRRKISHLVQSNLFLTRPRSRETASNVQIFIV